MSSNAEDRCRSCGDQGSWRTSHSRGFWEKRVLPLLGRRMFRCTVCGSRAALSSDREKVPVTGQAAEGRETMETPSSCPPSRDQQDFEELILQIRRSEERMDWEEEQAGR